MSATDNVYGSPNNIPPQDAELKKKPDPTLRTIRNILVVVAIVILAIFLVNEMFVITRPNEYVAIQQFGKIVSVTYDPGLSFKLPFVQTTRSIPKDVQLYDLPISDVITSDKKSMVADSFVLWRVSDPVKFIQTMGGNVVNSEVRINNIVYNSMKNVISSMPQSDIISGRDKLAGNIFTNIGGSLDQYGITLVAIETKRLDLPDDNKQAVYERMISERNNIAAAFMAEGDSEATQIRNETDKSVSIQLSKAKADAERTIAEGEAEYMRILAEAFESPERAEFYSFVRSLDAAKASLKGENKTLILSPNSPIAQLFYNAQ